jgi:hypothetical protein
MDREERRALLERRRAPVAHQLRRLAIELTDLDRQLDDISNQSGTNVWNGCEVTWFAMDHDIPGQTDLFGKPQVPGECACHYCVEDRDPEPLSCEEGQR